MTTAKRSSSTFTLNEGTTEYMKKFDLPTRKFGADVTNTIDDATKRARMIAADKAHHDKHSVKAQLVCKSLQCRKIVGRKDQALTGKAQWCKVCRKAEAIKVAKMSKADKSHRLKNRRADQQVCKSEQCNAVVGRKGQHTQGCGKWCKACRVKVANKHKVSHKTLFGEAPQVFHSL